MSTISGSASLPDGCSRGAPNCPSDKVQSTRAGTVLAGQSSTRPPTQYSEPSPSSTPSGPFANRSSTVTGAAASLWVAFFAAGRGDVEGLVHAERAAGAFAVVGTERFVLAGAVMASGSSPRPMDAFPASGASGTASGSGATGAPVDSARASVGAGAAVSGAGKRAARPSRSRA